ncbi:unnamed protein product [Meganyctiphanes norvegica]|uniref:FAD/NAD(P)-binding domain-containing protein n=1 Tax=Meganyctiphanes norvegica TaxID=48144 RepID=A0AAV2R1J6_MEGNR
MIQELQNFLNQNLEKDKIESNQPLKRRKYTVDGSQTQYGHIGGALGPDWHSGLRLSSDLKRKVTIEYQVEVKNIFSHEELINSGKSCCKLKEEPLDSIWPVYVELSNNKIYGCDFIVSATGVVPNISVFQDGNNLRLGSDGGLMINESMETSLSNVYAAGDVCSPSWEPAQHWFQMRLWTQARHMGSYAAKCMYSSLANEEIYMDFAFELFSHATKFFGYKVIILGLFNGQKLEGKYEILLRFTPGLEYIKCVMADGKMQELFSLGKQIWKKHLKT